MSKPVPAVTFFAASGTPLATVAEEEQSSGATQFYRVAGWPLLLAGMQGAPNDEVNRGGTMPSRAHHLHHGHQPPWSDY